MVEVKFPKKSRLNWEEAKQGLSYVWRKSGVKMDDRKSGDW